MFNRISTSAGVAAASTFFAIVIGWTLLVNHGGSAEDNKCKALPGITHTIQQDEFLSDVALQQLRDQRIDLPEGMSPQLAIKWVVDNIVDVNDLPTNTPSTGTSVKIPDLHDKACWP